MLRTEAYFLMLGIGGLIRRIIREHQEIEEENGRVEEREFVNTEGERKGEREGEREPIIID